MFIFIGFYPAFYENGVLNYINTLNEQVLPYSYGVELFLEPYNKIGFLARGDSIKRYTFGGNLIFKEGSYGFQFFPLFSLGDSSIYPNKKWKGKFYGAIYDGSVFYNNDRFFILLGNTHINFKTAPLSSPILSMNIPPLPLLFYNIKIWKLSISHLISNLGLYKGSKFDPTINPYVSISINRYLLIHRFEFNFGKLGIGLTEIGLIGKNEGLDFYLLNPIGIIYEHQFNFRKESNIMWNFDIHLLYRNLYIYSNLFIDDFQYEYDPFNEPNHIGLNLGLLGKLNDRIFLYTEYNIFTRWVYGHFLVYQRYIYNGYPLGIENSSDFDEISGSLIYKKDKEFYFLTLKYRRKGETNPDTPWPLTYEETDTIKFPDDNFLSGNIKKRYVLTFEFEKEFKLASIIFGSGIIYEERLIPVLKIGIIKNFKSKIGEIYE